MDCVCMCVWVGVYTSCDMCLLELCNYYMNCNLNSPTLRAHAVACMNTHSLPSLPAGSSGGVDCSVGDNGSFTSARPSAGNSGGS